MKKKEIYITEDGEEFLDIDAARRHEEKLEADKRKVRESTSVMTDSGKLLYKKDIKEFFEKIKDTKCYIDCPFLDECNDLEKNLSDEDPYTLCDLMKGRKIQ